MKNFSPNITTGLSHARPEAHQVNLAADPKYTDKLAEMESLLLSEMRRLHDP